VPYTWQQIEEMIDIDPDYAAAGCPSWPPPPDIMRKMAFAPKWWERERDAREKREAELRRDDGRRFLRCLGRVLCHERIRSHRYLKDVAAACGMSAATLSRFETGRRTGSVDQLRRIAVAIGRPLADLIAAAEAEAAASKPPSDANDRLGNDAFT
jgi:transcriptional regulator with XRE-family HTH domain